MNDLVLISGLKLPVHIGCEPGERTLPQVLEFDFEIGSAASDAYKSGNPNDSVNYKLVCEILRE